MIGRLYDKAFFGNLIKNADIYYSHVSNDNKSVREKLVDHCVLTMKYAKSIAASNGLDGIIKGLIEKSTIGPCDARLHQMVYQLFWDAIAYHDLGKLNDQFQKNKMKNNQKLKIVLHNFGSNHSLISAYLYLAISVFNLLDKNITENDEIVFLCNIALFMSYSIAKHHSSELGECENMDFWTNIKSSDLSPYISFLNINMSEDKLEKFNNFLSGIDDAFDYFNDLSKLADHNYPVYALVRLCYSLLTASDYLATAHFMNNWKGIHAGKGFINSVLRDKIIYNVHNSKVYNHKVFDYVDKGIVPKHDVNQRCNESLNNLRCDLAYDVVTNIRHHLGERLFYIDAPTGAGKTNVSMLALGELLDADSSIKNIFYVFPFTTLITQTYESLKETLGLEDDEIAEIHSKAPVKSSDGKYENEDQYLNYLDQMFMDYPITLMSHIKFFNVLKTNVKESNYLIHRLANSVVIIDELQSYPPRMWNKIICLISWYAQYFNMKFILMSATLPKIGKLLMANDRQDPFTYLVPDRDKYFRNPNFCNRVSFDYSLLEKEKPNDDTKGAYLKELFNVVEEKSYQYSTENKDNVNGVFTIVEFITKRTANTFYSLAKEVNGFFDNIVILSGTILEPRRRMIISSLKSRCYRNSKLLLITTQVVEAGVDIDMDLGFKDKSLIDSEEQLAGRINRNCNKDNCKLYLFDCDSEKSLYGKDERYEIMTKSNADSTAYKEILASKDFDKLYDMIMSKIKQQNKSAYIQNIHDFYEAIKSLNFPEINRSICLIDQKNVTVFVPLQIPSSMLGNVVAIANEFGLLDNDNIDGRKVWDFFEELVTAPDEDFIKNKIKMKQILSLMSQFSFCIYPYGKDYDIIHTFGYEKYGFLYLNSWEDLYSFDEGINSDKFTDTNFL